MKALMEISSPIITDYNICSVLLSRFILLISRWWNRRIFITRLHHCKRISWQLNLWYWFNLSSGDLFTEAIRIRIAMRRNRWKIVIVLYGPTKILHSRPKMLSTTVEKLVNCVHGRLLCWFCLLLPVTLSLWRLSIFSWCHQQLITSAATQIITQWVLRDVLHSSNNLGDRVIVLLNPFIYPMGVIKKLMILFSLASMSSIPEVNISQVMALPMMLR